MIRKRPYNIPFEKNGVIYKKCGGCGNVYERDSFPSNGKLSKGGVCYECKNRRQRKYYPKIAKERQKEEREKRYHIKENDPIKYRAMIMHAGTARRCREFKIPVNKNFICVDNIIKILKKHKKCVCCGKEFVFIGNRNDIPTMDRIDASGGYDYGNVAIVCLRCNATKSNATIEELETITAYMKKYLRNPVVLKRYWNETYKENE